MKTNMQFGASPAIFKRARDLRNHPTPAEEILWQELRKNQMGCRFRRQHPLSTYVVDFYCHTLRFVIEVDGNIHTDSENQKTDIEREDVLKGLGLFILRFSNDQIYNSLDAVLSIIWDTIHNITYSGFRSQYVNQMLPFIREH